MIPCPIELPAHIAIAQTTLETKEYDGKVERWLKVIWYVDDCPSALYSHGLLREPDQEKDPVFWQRIVSQLESYLRDHPVHS